jgi:hypothetical protein
MPLSINLNINYEDENYKIGTVCGAVLVGLSRKEIKVDSMW